MRLELWYLLLGALLVIAALSASLFKRLPLTTTMFYLAVGVVLGPSFLDFASLHPLDDAGIIEHLAELAVIVSLFTAGLKLRTPFLHGRWKIPVSLASGSMVLTIGMITLVAMWGLGLPLGAAVLLGAILAPTDPVLASDVQLESTDDRDRLRFSLTGEAGLNDGSAFPFVMLGLGLLGLWDLGQFGWKWFALDVVWAVFGGLAIGSGLGVAVGRTVLWMRQRHRLGLGREEFLTLGLIGVSYGAAVAMQTYGFLAVFAAGLALRRVERRETDTTPTNESANSSHADEPELTAAELTKSVLGFNEQFERVLEVGLVLVLGLMLTPEFLKLEHVWFVPVLLLVIRPISVWIGTLGQKASIAQRGLMSWFGIRGIGSIYYLAYAIQKEVPSDTARILISVTLWVIATSVVVHGISVTPLMEWYGKRRRRRMQGEEKPASLP